MAAVDLRYARALAAVVSNQNLNLAAVQGQLNDFADTLEASASSARFWRIRPSLRRKS